MFYPNLYVKRYKKQIVACTQSGVHSGDIVPFPVS